LRPGVPTKLQKIIDKCLIKNPDQRYQHMGDIVDDLKTISENIYKKSLSSGSPIRTSSGRKRIYFGMSITAVLILLIIAIIYISDSGVTHSIDSIAVLPFENLTGDPSQEYFVIGMTDAIITNLAQVSSLRVISRRSVMQYKGVQKSIKEIAQELNVDAILEGSVFKDRKRIRISTNLVDPSTERHLWAENFDRELKDILSLQNKVSLAVVQEVKIALTKKEESLLLKSPTVNPMAHEAFLRGQYSVQQFTMGQGTVDNLKEGINYYQQAITFDPDWAKAHASLAYAYSWLASNIYLKKYFTLSKAAALRAIEIDETLSQAHGILAFVLHKNEWDWDGAANEYRRAIELNPNEFAWGIALFSMSAGFYEDAILWYKRAEERNPLSTILKRELAWAYSCAGQNDRSLNTLLKTLELDSNSVRTRAALAKAYLNTNMFEKAVKMAESAEYISDNPRFIAQLGYIYASVGRTRDARNILTRLEKNSPMTYAYELVNLLLKLKEKKKALSLIEKSYENREGLILYINQTLAADSLKDNSTFQNILSGINFPKKRFDFLVLK
jgi:TolB-like protein/Flp pilus assembly protein TadD